ncbi:MAG: hypothetical protein U9R77_03380 [Pseudomonadota bacterium]|uniref:hypothetical protein n=1 Tax=Sphingobium naphthae TaxID=1886786 RepID=UPI002B146093|nr:hypothetical protein [Pseudomonadota bacterium]
MTTISNYSMAMPPSPRAMMDRRIDAAVEAGSVSEVDSAAMETALDSIDSGLSASAGSETGRLDPSAMQDRIDSLIEDQLSAGTLTQEQAAQLQGFFAQGPGAPSSTDSASADSAIDGLSGVGGAGPMRGPLPGPPPAASEEEGSTSSSATSETDTAGTTEQLDSIIAFLENLRTSLSQSLYGSVASNSDSSSSGLVVDSLA